jgi:hypothetical protein
MLPKILLVLIRYSANDPEFPVNDRRLLWPPPLCEAGDQPCIDRFVSTQRREWPCSGLK